jgi:hypothetical protein
MKNRRHEPKHDLPSTSSEKNEPGENLMKTSRLIWGEPTSNWLMVLLTLLLVGVTYLQWNAARDAINDSRQAFQRSERAYLCLKDSKIRPTKAGPSSNQWIIDDSIKADRLTKAPFLEVDLVNAGKTPAKHATYVASVVLKNSPPSDDATLNDDARGENLFHSDSVVAPDGLLVVSGFLRAVITPELAAKIKTGSLSLYIYGKVTYQDIFSESRTTRFCSVFMPERNDMSDCTTYNDVD